MNYRGIQMKRIFSLLCASALMLSGCNRTSQTAGEPVPQKITETAGVSANSVEPAATAIVEATPSLGDKSAAKKEKILPRFDIKEFHVARTLEVPYYEDTITGLIFSPDSKMVAGIGHGHVFDKAEGGERGVVFLFDVKSGVLLKRLASEALPEAKGLGPSFDRAVWSPDGKYIAAWNEDSSGRTAAALCVWDAESGQRTAVFRNANWQIADVAWMRDGSMLVARGSQPNPADLTAKGQLMVCNGHTGQINTIYDLGQQAVASIHVPRKGAPQLLTLKSVGEKRTDREPDAQSSIRSFNAGALSQPLLQFRTREVYWAAAFDKNGLVALSGIEQDEGGDGPVAALYAVGDLKTGKIVWQSKQKTIDFSLQVFLSPDEKQLWARTLNNHGDFVLDMANGKLSVSPENQFPFFAPNGKFFVRLLNSGKYTLSGQRLPAGKKPHLKIAQIWER